MTLVTLNGTTIQGPADLGWVPPNTIGVGGRGDNVVPAFREFFLVWNFMYPEDFSVVWNIWNDNQGQDIIANLPELGAATYTFRNYTCRINPISTRGFFNRTYANVRTTLVGIDITA